MVTELVSDITVTRDAYASKNTISWLLDNVSALGERGSFDVHLIGKSTLLGWCSECLCQISAL